MNSTIDQYHRNTVCDHVSPPVVRKQATPYNLPLPLPVLGYPSLGSPTSNGLDVQIGQKRAVFWLYNTVCIIRKRNSYIVT